jgi:hypothetical protein
LNQFTDFYEIWYNRYIVRGHPNAALFNFPQLVITPLDARVCEIGATLAQSNPEICVIIVEIYVTFAEVISLSVGFKTTDWRLNKCVFTFGFDGGI